MGRCAKVVATYDKSKPQLVSATPILAFESEVFELDQLP